MQLSLQLAAKLLYLLFGARRRVYSPLAAALEPPRVLMFADCRKVGGRTFRRLLHQAEAASVMVIQLQLG